MIKRLSVGILLAAILMAFLLWLRPISLFFVDALIIAVIAVACYEVTVAFKNAGYNPILGALAIFLLGVYPCIYFLNSAGLILILAISALVALIEFTFNHSIELKDMFITFFILIYPCTLISIFFLINMGVGSLLGIFLVIFIACFTDTFALFVGVIFKGKKLCENISPKKTISGAIGGLFGGMLGAVIVFLLFDVAHLFDGFKNTYITSLIYNNIGGSIALYLVLGFVGSILGQVGDLAASWIKRKTDIKDFGKIFPGHGGIVDRLDSIMFVIPLIYFTFLIIEAV